MHSHSVLLSLLRFLFYYLLIFFIQFVYALLPQNIPVFLSSSVDIFAKFFLTCLLLAVLGQKLPDANIRMVRIFCRLVQLSNSLQTESMRIFEMERDMDRYCRGRYCMDRYYKGRYCVDRYYRSDTALTDTIRADTAWADTIRADSALTDTIRAVSAWADVDTIIISWTDIDIRIIAIDRYLISVYFEN